MQNSFGFSSAVVHASHNSGHLIVHLSQNIRHCCDVGTSGQSKEVRLDPTLDPVLKVLLCCGARGFRVERACHGTVSSANRGSHPEFSQGFERGISEVWTDIGVIKLDGGHETGTATDGLGCHGARKDDAATVVEVSGVGIE